MLKFCWFYLVWVFMVLGGLVLDDVLVSAMIYTDKKVSFNSQYYVVATFGFVDGGDLEFNATIDAANLENGSEIPTHPTMAPLAGGMGVTVTGGSTTSKNYFDFLTLWVCEDNDYQSLIGSSPNNDIESKLCNSPTDGVCPVRNITVTNNFTFQYTFEKADLYKIILLKCNTSTSVDVTLDYTMMNKGHHLSLGYIQMPSVYVSMVIIITILISAYALYLARYKRFLNELHMVISLILVFKLLLVVLSLLYWKTADTTGHYNNVINNLKNLLFSIEETVFFGGLLLMSKGWRVTRANLLPSEIRTISIIMVLLLSVLMFFSFYNDVYYFLSLMILYFFMMPKLFTNITKNLRLLETHITLAQYTNNARSVNIYQVKTRAFQSLRTAVVLYLGGILIVNSMRIIMVWFLYWVTFSVSEPMSILMLTFICLLFRPYSRNPIFLNSNLDSISIVELSRNLADMTGQSLDPLSLMGYFDIKSYDPKNCIIIDYPGNSTSSLGVLDTKE